MYPQVPIRSLALVVLALSMATQGSPAQERPMDLPTLAVPPIVDGALDTGEWRDALRFAGFGPAPARVTEDPAVQTTVWAALADGALYLAFACDGWSGPVEPRRNLNEISVVYPDRDWVSVAVDTYGDAMEAYAFAVSTNGATADGFLWGNGRAALERDFKWEVALRKTTGGYSVEMRVPLSELSYDDGAGAVWGLRWTRWSPVAGREVVAPEPRRSGGLALQQALRVRPQGLPRSTQALSSSIPLPPDRAPDPGASDVTTLAGRDTVWRDPDITDYLLFPESPLVASSRPRPFAARRDTEASITRLLEDLEYRPGERIADLNRFLTRSSTTALLVIRNDTVVFERYANGYDRTSLQTSFSVAKSFLSTLVGIALDRGFIGSLSDPITRYVPELRERDPRFDEIQIRHLISMRSGLRYEEGDPIGDDAATYYSPDLRQAALTRTTVVGAPGEAFLYNNYNPLLVGLVLERSTGRTVTQLLQEWLWDPVGMEYGGSWSLDSEASGFEKLESGINARAIDFAKLGRLFINGGRAGAQDVVPESWVQMATQPEPRGGDATKWNDGYYKYFWWGLYRGDGPHDFTAWGNMGQYVYVSPQNGVVIVRQGIQYAISSDDWIRLFSEISGQLPQE